jgi:hypothetical protein
MALLAGGILSASVTTLLAAVLAVVGTLTAPLLTQRLASNARMQELDAARRERMDERDEARRQAAFLDRRNSYTALHTAAWDFRRALKNYLFDSSSSEELENVRQAFLASYRNMQMICTDPVLRVAAPVYDELTQAYGDVRELDAHDPSGDALALPSTSGRGQVQRALNSSVEDSLRRMRRTMRVDLGASESDSDT